MDQQYEGRLELTWTNKHLALLAHEDGKYEWLPHADYRVAEVRLLRELDRVGTDRSADHNLLIVGDALNALVSLARLPELAGGYVGKVKLAYIDPPFNTKQSFLQYNDALEHSVWLTMMRDRLVQIKGLLAPTGSVWVHCDDSEQAYLKAVMDEVFGRACFVTAFLWRKVDSPNDNKVPITPDHEYILCYTKVAGGGRFKQMAADSILDAYPLADESTGQRCRDRLLKKNGKNSLRSDRETMFFEIPGPDGEPVFPIHDDGREARWSKGRKTVLDLLAAGKVIWKQRENAGATKWIPYVREYAPPVPTRPRPSIWTDLPTTRQAKQHLRELFPGVTPFETPKPEELIARILETASEPGDLVLDCFVGSGTTAAVAHKMGRRWVVSERDPKTVATFVRPRLESVVAGDDPGGITDAMGWEGGGGFRIVEVGPSMFAAEDGVVVLANWADNGALARATAAQLGYDFDATPPFCGRRGRSRLAVVDGLVNVDVVRILATALPDEERLVICATAVDPLAHDEATRIRPGTRVRKIPDSLLYEYRRRASDAETRPAPAPATAPASVGG